MLKPTRKARALYQASMTLARFAERIAPWLVCMSTYIHRRPGRAAILVAAILVAAILAGCSTGSINGDRLLQAIEFGPEECGEASITGNLALGGSPWISSTAAVDIDKQKPCPPRTVTHENTQATEPGAQQ